MDYYYSLDQKIYDLTWQGKLWGRGGAIAWSRTRYLHFKALGRGGDGAMALSSTYYTAWGNAFAQMKQVRFILKPLWLIRGIYCAFWALAWSRHAEKEIGLENMTHGQLDVRASILAKWRRYEKARRCLAKALSRKDITADSKVLVLVKLGEVCDALGKRNLAANNYWEAYRVKGLKPTTEVRVLKSFGQHWRIIKNEKRAREHFERALILAEKNNLGDQMVKIKALMKK